MPADHNGGVPLWGHPFGTGGAIACVNQLGTALATEIGAPPFAPSAMKAGASPELSKT